MALTDSEIDTENNSGAQTASRTFDKIGTAAAEFNDSDARMSNASADLPANFGDDDLNASPLSWIIPLVLLFLLVGLGYAFCSNPAA